MAKLLRNVALSALAAGAVVLVWRAANAERESTRYSRSSLPDIDPDDLGEEELDLLLKEFVSHF